MPLFLKLNLLSAAPDELWDKSSLACSAAGGMRFLWRVVVLIGPLLGNEVVQVYHICKALFAPRDPAFLQSAQ